MRSAVTLLLFTTLAFAQDIPKTKFPPVRGLHEMVGAANNIEVDAGMRMLALGGNAVDAGVATILTAAVTEQSRIGLGGEAPMLIKMKGQPVVAISGIGNAVRRRVRPKPWKRSG